jgi:hypothetical protein
MRIPEHINGLVKVCENIYRETCRSGGASGRPELFRLQQAELRARLSALGARQVYLVLATCELGRRMWRPNDFSRFARFYGCLCSSYTPAEAIDRLMKQACQLAGYLHSGLVLLHRAGIDVHGLLESGLCRSNNRSRTAAA